MNNRLRFTPEQLLSVLEAELRQGDEAPTGRLAIARPMVAGEVELPCHPRERVSLAAGALDASCPDCGRTFPVGAA